MKRSLFTLLTLLLLGVVVAGLSYCFHIRQPETGWLQKEFSLSNEQAQRIEVMHRDYGEICMKMCAHIEESDTHLAELLGKSTHVTPEIREALAETDQVRTACRTRMLEYFYEVAAVMPEEQRRRYLKMLYPLIQHPEKMGAYQHSLRGH